MEINHMSKAQSKTKTTSSKKTATQVLATTEGKGSSVTPEQRQRMIAEAAYYRAFAALLNTPDSAGPNSVVFSVVIRNRIGWQRK